MGIEKLNADLDRRIGLGGDVEIEQAMDGARQSQFGRTQKSMS